MTCSPWATSADAIAPCNGYGVDPVELDLAMAIASDILFAFTRKKYPGACTDDIRPLARYRASEGPPRWWPVLGNVPRGQGSRYGYCSCNRAPDYGCTAIPRITLPGYPVDRSSIVVTIDGVQFDSWELVDRRRLVRTDGEGWPCCQDLRLPLTELHTWGVHYGWGAGPPRGGKRSAVLLGCQLYQAWHPIEGVSCQLPQRVTNITRAGVSMAVLDPLTLFDKQKTGLPMVDLWVASQNAEDAAKSTLIVPGRGPKQGRRA